MNRNVCCFSVCCCDSVAQSCLFVTPWTAACQAFLSFSISGSCSNSYPLSWWCHLTISASVVPFSFCSQSFPASGSFLMSQLCTSGGQSIGASPSASLLLVNIQDWFPLGLAGLISLQFKGLSVLIHSNQWTSDQQEWSLVFSLGERTRRETCLKSWMGSGQEHLSGLPLNLQSRLHLNHLRWMDLLGGTGDKAPTCPCRRHRRYRFDP